MKIRKLEQYFLRALQLKNRSVSREEGSEVCQSVFEVVTCTRARQPGGFSPLPPIKIENYVEQTLRHLHKSTYWIDGCVSNRPRGQIYARRCLDACPRVHARLHFQIARPCRSIAKFLERSRDRTSTRVEQLRRRNSRRKSHAHMNTR